MFIELVMSALEETMEWADEKRKELLRTKVPKHKSVALSDDGAISYKALVTEVENLAQECGFDPYDATIVVNEDEGAFFPSHSIEVAWEAMEFPTQNEVEEQIEKLFSYKAFKAVFEKLTANGYKRVPVRSNLLFDFNPYRAFIAGDTKSIEKYYGLYFMKKEEE